MNRRQPKYRAVDPGDPIEAVRIALDEVVHILFGVLEHGGATLTLHGKPASVQDVRLHVDGLVSKIKSKTRSRK
jgi:hypothetical protein